MAMTESEQQMYSLAITLLTMSIGALALLAEHATITGFVVSEQASSSANQLSPIAIQTLTVQDAKNAIWEGERIMADLYQRGIGVQFINEKLIEARRVLQKANYTVRLQQAQATNDMKTAALLQDALNLLNGTYSGATVQESYAEVIRLVNSVKERQDPAYLLIDKLTITKQKLTDYGGRGLPTEKAGTLLAQAEQSFRDERYEEALRYLDEVNAALEQVSEESPLQRALVESSKDFFEKNWKQFLILLALFAIAGWFGWRGMAIYQLKRRITRLTLELESIENLIKQTQCECFELKTISKMVHDLRMDTYRKRRVEIQVLLPTSEEELRTMTKKQADSPAPSGAVDRSGALKVAYPESKKKRTRKQ